MIEINFKIEKREKADYQPIPEDVYQCELIDVEIQEHNKYQSEEKENVFSFTFGVVDEGEFRARRLWKNFVPTYLYVGKNGKNALYQIVEALLRRELTPEDEATLDTDVINELIGRQVRVLTNNKTTGDKTFTNIKSFLRTTEAQSPLVDEEKKITKDDNVQ